MLLRFSKKTAAGIKSLLDTVQADLLERARRERDSRISIVTKWEDFVPALDRGHMVLAPWSEDLKSEEWVKEQTKATGATELAPGAEGEEEDGTSMRLSGAAKTLCIPLEQPPMPEGQLCFTGNGLPAVSWTLWGRSY